MNCDGPRALNSVAAFFFQKDEYLCEKAAHSLSNHLNNAHSQRELETFTTCFGGRIRPTTRHRSDRLSPTSAIVNDRPFGPSRPIHQTIVWTSKPPEVLHFSSSPAEVREAGKRVLTHVGQRSSQTTLWCWGLPTVSLGSCKAACYTGSESAREVFFRWKKCKSDLNVTF